MLYIVPKYKRVNEFTGLDATTLRRHDKQGVRAGHGAQQARALWAREPCHELVALRKKLGPEEVCQRRGDGHRFRETHSHRAAKEQRMTHHLPDRRSRE